MVPHGSCLSIIHTPGLYCHGHVGLPAISTEQCLFGVKKQTRDPVVSAEVLQDLKYGEQQGRDLHLRGKRWKKPPRCWHFVQGRVTQQTRAFHCPLKPKSSPRSESGVGGLIAGLEGKTRSNSPTEHKDVEINKLFPFTARLPAQLFQVGG